MPPESSGLGNGVSEKDHIWFQYAATLSTGGEVEVFASTLELHITIRPSDWDVNFAIGLHDHISFLESNMLQSKTTVTYCSCILFESSMQAGRLAAVHMQRAVMYLHVFCLAMMVSHSWTA